jgi:sarcosine oxidase subunit gamma
MIVKRSPLEGMSLGTVTTVAIRELPGLHTIDLRVTPGTSTQSAVAEALDMTLPGRPGQSLSVSVSGAGEAHVLCLAPDWWLIAGFQEAERKLAPLLLNDDYHFSLVDVSDQRTTIELEGSKVREVIAHVWEQDLREASFPVGSVSQGLIAKAPVILFYIGPFRYRVMVRSSFALHLWRVLEDAAAEWL